MFWKKNQAQTDSAWTRAGILKAIAKELSSLDPVVHKNTLTFKKDIILKLTFIQKEYVDQDLLSFEVLISMTPAGVSDFERYEAYFRSLRLSEFRMIFGKDSTISIKKNEPFPGSTLQQDFATIYHDVIVSLISRDTCLDFLKGKSVIVNGKAIDSKQLEQLEVGVSSKKLAEASEAFEEDIS